MIKFFSDLKNKINEQTIFHWMKGAGDNTAFLRVPDNPIGIAVREQGQVDLYAGTSRFILGINGIIFEKGTSHIMNTEEFHLVLKDIKSFTILDKYINELIFNGKPISTVTETGIKEYKSNDGLNFIKSQCLVLDYSGSPIGYVDPSSMVPVQNILNFEALFQDTDKTMVPMELEMFTHLKGLRESK